MAARFQSSYLSGSSEDSELEDDLWLERFVHLSINWDQFLMFQHMYCSTGKLSLAHNELYNDDFEFRLSNQIQTNNHLMVNMV